MVLLQSIFMETAAGSLLKLILPELSQDIIFTDAVLSDFMCLVQGILLVTMICRET